MIKIIKLHILLFTDKNIIKINLDENNFKFLYIFSRIYINKTPYTFSINNNKKLHFKYEK